MDCPNSECEGSLILTRQALDYLGMLGEVPRLDPTDWEDEFVICNGCGEMPDFTWEGNRIILIEGKGESSNGLHMAHQS